MAYNIPFSNAKVKQVLSAFHIKPNKLLGQNFLVDPGILQKIVISADITEQDTILEIGPGLGILTQALAKKARRVIAVEKDQAMAVALAKVLGNTKNVEIIQGDILRINDQIPMPNDQSNPKSQNTKYKVVANLPYYITSPVIRKFLEAKQKPKLMVLMVQKEVAQRICAKPPNMNLLAVSVQFYAKPEIVSYVKKTSFWPQPKVDSAIIKITPVNNSNDRRKCRQEFFEIARAGFKQPRKQLVNNLAKGLGAPREKINQWFAENSLEPMQRAETLRIEDWRKLAKSFKE